MYIPPKRFFSVSFDFVERELKTCLLCTITFTHTYIYPWWFKAIKKLNSNGNFTCHLNVADLQWDARNLFTVKWSVKFLFIAFSSVSILMLFKSLLCSNLCWCIFICCKEGVKRFFKVFWRHCWSCNKLKRPIVDHAIRVKELRN